MFYRNCSQLLVPILLIFRKLCRTMPLFFFGCRTCEPALHATSRVYYFRSQSWKLTTGTHYPSPTPQCTKQLILEYRTASGTNITAKESRGKQFRMSSATQKGKKTNKKKKAHGRV
uniref:Putative secreted protein n=1 Tax=Ixodes ricinus TaxID=34613 RepID=A0A6B0UM91_IXORI